MKIFSLLFIIALSLPAPGVFAEPSPHDNFYPVHRTMKGMLTFVPVMTILTFIPYGISLKYLSNQDSASGLLVGGAVSNAAAFVGSASVLVSLAKNPNAFLGSYYELPWYGFMGFPVAFLGSWAQTVFLITAGVQIAAGTVLELPERLWSTEMAFSSLSTFAVSSVLILYRFRAFRPVQTPLTEV